MVLHAEMERLIAGKRNEDNACIAKSICSCGLLPHTPFITLLFAVHCEGAR